MRTPPSSPLGELRWLLAFLAIFAVITFLMLKFVVPHHFNDRVAVTISALLAGVIWMILRANAARRA
ncbi:MAG TPA: hypothetical protein VIG32_11190 [Candidatus Baltobacteraceae bacterium]